MAHDVLACAPMGPAETRPRGGVLQQRTSHLVIVSREHPAIFDRLCERFEDSPGLRVIFDRRKTPHEPEMPERREGDLTETRLATEGFVVVTIRH